MAAQIKEALVVLRRKQLEAKIGLSRSAVYARINPASPQFDPNFPKPIEMGCGKNPPVGWLSHEVDAWLALLVQNSREA